MRIRQVKPAFWSDAKLAELPEPTRLFYIGLWMIADDAGWFRWDPVEVARDLYGYDTRRRREPRTIGMFDQLVGAGRIVLHDCGHAVVPKLADHQHLASTDKQVRTTYKEHARACPLPPANTRGDSRDSEETRLGKVGEGIGRERLGKVSDGRRANARENDDLSDFDRGIVANGGTPLRRKAS